MSTATDMLAAYIAAETAVLSGAEYRLGDRMLKKADLEFIQAGRREWQAKVNAENAATTRVPTMGGLGYSVATFGQR